ncbi:UDP-N-acetylmuramate--L-alanine ligase [Scatolibacter rhodanostii]|uniref:UDP-N-acetylmuramate--L-alanine ligase n=1 Tax=Scatolibacter rhodanostii TaxID=2014781 RepID=UPI000C08439D|nr:UDP-N-acetylmuramate--L-alanine ligase [Scatolibacter rhodanostii]
MKHSILDTAKKVHFIGIGGSGMCPMAEMLYKRGYIITGSDLYESETLDRVRALGIPVTVGHAAENVGDAEIVVYTAAARKDNPEILEGNRRGLAVMERSVMLGLITDQFAKSVAISGTHGKTTTTALITQILVESGLDPNAIIGGKLPLIGGNCRVADTDYMVCEACEYVDTFLQLHPHISVITNIDADHLDYFKTLDNIIKSFHQFASQTSNIVVVNGDNLNSMKSIEKIENAKIVTFGFKDTNDYYPLDMNEEPTACEDFTLMHHGEKLGRVELKVPGEHNLFNALAAAAVGDILGVSGEQICRSLGNFTGVHRRFEILGEFNGVTIADDFAHHPTELTAVLSSAMKMGYQKVWAVFQPHTYSRTYDHLDEFAEALSISDRVVMSEILAVREENVYGIKTADLAEKISNSVWFDGFDEISDYVIEQAQPGDLILTLGGGDIYKCANMIVDKYKKK